MLLGYSKNYVYIYIIHPQTNLRSRHISLFQLEKLGLIYGGFPPLNGGTLFNNLTTKAK